MPTQALVQILREFLPLFTSLPTFENFATIVVGWILCTGRHTISRMILFGQERKGKHHSALYRFFSRAKWDADALGEKLLHLALVFVPGSTPVCLSVDDTLCRRAGPRVWGAAMHRDPVNSSYGLGGGTVKFAFGQNRVVLCVWIPLPWSQDRGVAIPILWRLYRTKKRCPANVYRKRTELARELIGIVRGWLPSRQLVLVGDAEYSCKNVVRELPENVTFVGPIEMKARIFDLPPVHLGKGRPRKKGARLPTPTEYAEAKSPRWKKLTVRIYGRDVALHVKTFVGLWYTVAYTRPVRVVVTRDPKGRLDDRAFFCTDPSSTPEQILTSMSRRWAQEVMHRDVKQHLGLEEPQNGWWRQPAGKRPQKPVAGPQGHPTRGELAARRTAPLAFVVYALVVLSYVRRGNPEAEVQRVRQLAPWYRQKATPSFNDMLLATRREVWASRLLADPSLRGLSLKVAEKTIARLLAA